MQSAVAWAAVVTKGEPDRARSCSVLSVPMTISPTENQPTGATAAVESMVAKPSAAARRCRRSAMSVVAPSQMARWMPTCPVRPLTRARAMREGR